MKNKLQMLRDSEWFMASCEAVIIALTIYTLVPWLLKGIAIVFCIVVIFMSLNNK